MCIAIGRQELEIFSIKIKYSMKVTFYTPQISYQETMVGGGFSSLNGARMPRGLCGECMLRLAESSVDLFCKDEAD